MLLLTEGKVFKEKFSNGGGKTQTRRGNKSEGNFRCREGTRAVIHVGGTTKELGEDKSAMNLQRAQNQI